MHTKPKVESKQMISTTNEMLTAKKCCNCNDREAEIFQISGDYCLQCWQETTHTEV